MEAGGWLAGKRKGVRRKEKDSEGLNMIRLC